MADTLTLVEVEARGAVMLVYSDTRPAHQLADILEHELPGDDGLEASTWVTVRLPGRPPVARIAQTRHWVDVSSDVRDITRGPR